jgi:hypothetical protein
MSVDTAARSEGLPGTFDQSWVLVRWQWTALANVLRSYAASGKGQLVRIAIGAAIVVSYALDTLHDVCKAYAPALQQSSLGPAPICTIAAAVIGVVVGVALAGCALRLARSAWLAALAISSSSRLRAAAAFGACLGAGITVPVVVTGWLAASWLRAASPTAAAALVGVTYVGGFSLALTLRILHCWLSRSRPPVGRSSMLGVQGSAGRSSAGPDSRSALPFARLDQRRPRWLGHWVLEWTPGLRPTPVFVFLIITNGIGVVASIVQAQEFPALVFAVLTTHVVYLRTLRMAPLASPVLRTGPLDFNTALLGAVRLPLLLSFAASVPLIVTALTIGHAQIDRTLGYLAVLLLLAAQFSVLAAAIPNARGAAIVMHLAIVMIALKEAILYQYWIPLVLAVFTGFMWWRAKRRYDG